MATPVPRFTPRTNNNGTTASSPDRISRILQGTGFALLAVVVGLLPLLTFFTQFVTVGFTKTMIVLSASLLALVCLCLSVLRSGSVQFSLSPTIGALWGLALVALVSALVSSDQSDALVGETFEVHTTAFLCILALVATLASLFSQSRAMTLRFFQVLFLSTIFLGLFHLIRLLFGADVLSFGVFTTALASPLGAWNDLAIFFGLSTVLTLIVLEHMPLSKLGQGFAVLLVVLSLLILAVVNFFYVWVFVGIISLMFLMYSLTRGRASHSTMNAEVGSEQPLLPIIAYGVVFAVAAVFVLGGSFIGNWISEQTNISYVEVRPSFTATIDIARSVYNENAFTGIGPNRFADAWRLYKDPSINTTIFWNTNFAAGSGYIPTWFVTTGIFGMLAWLLFLGSFIYLGYRTLVLPPQSDRFWYFVGLSSFVSALFIWGISFVYVTGAALLLYAAFSTGLTVAAYSKLAKKNSGRTFLLADRKTGFALIAAVMLFLIGSVSVMYLSTRQYAAVYTFSKAINSPEATLDSARTGIADALALRTSDTFLRQLGRLETERVAALSQVPEPNEDQISEYQQSVARGVGALRQAVILDPTHPLNHGFLSQLYFIIAGASQEELRTEANQLGSRSIEQAIAYEPLNPEYHLLGAQLATQAGNIETARERVARSIELKPDFTPAFNLLAQIDIAEGNTEAAIASVRSIIRLEPDNPARFYQLGILLSASGDVSGAISALEGAVVRDPEYANARYVLALAYLEEGRQDAAIEQLTIVRDLNPDNANVDTLIDQIASGEITNVSGLTPTDAVNEPPQVSSDGDVTTTTVDPETDLVTPLNPLPSTEEGADQDAEPATEQAPLDTNSATSGSPAG